MNFRQRITRYLIGLGIGSLVVFMMFPDHDWLGWTPEKKVMEQIREVQFDISSQSNCQMQCLNINLEQIQLARKDGHVDFDKSQVKQNPRLYHVNYGNVNLQIAMNDTLAVLKDISVVGQTCNCP